MEADYQKMVGANRETKPRSPMIRKLLRQILANISRRKIRYAGIKLNLFVKIQLLSLKS